MNILLTGSQGFIGRNIKERFADQWPEHKITGLDMRSGGDLCHNLLGYLEYEPSTPVDVVFHLAAASGVRDSRISNIEDHNLTIVKQLCTWATRRGVKTIVHASSSSVYGDVQTMDESRQPAPKSAYAKSKVLCETYLNEWAKNNGAVVVHLRLFNNIGKYQRANMFPYMVAQNLIEGKPLKLLGTRTRGWTYVGDTVTAFHSAMMFHQSRAGMNYVFNVGTGDTISQLELIEMFERVADKRASWTQVEPHEADVQSTKADTGRFSSVFGWKPCSSSLVHGVNEVLTYVDHCR